MGNHILVQIKQNTHGSHYLGSTVLLNTFLCKTCHESYRALVPYNYNGYDSIFQLYDSLKAEQSGFRNKLHAVTGDVQKENLGITESDQELLEQCIHVVFHSAATIRFDEPLR